MTFPKICSEKPRRGHDKRRNPVPSVTLWQSADHLKLSNADVFDAAMFVAASLTPNIFHPGWLLCGHDSPKDLSEETPTEKLFVR